ncbi:MAG: RNA polymerase sigma factor [Candidatus Fervidibacter sp.]|uniref:RNA polymerase sigma factor n=1 Tax=Candidatus Fervidibacter sp. TaxID=3100871 RepID=UPI00404A6239
MPSLQRATLLLRYGEEMSIQEIAQAPQVPTGTVKVLLFHKGGGKAKGLTFSL